MREQIRKLVGDGGNTKQQADVVMDSEDEEFEADYLSNRLAVPKPPDVTAAIMEALKKNIVFRGIPENLLEKVGSVLSAAPALARFDIPIAADGC